ncbi:MAG: sigma-70 family RNA polymerase sigma factor [bacterium]|nr:sigma-70 family RNA polymerase sigma factor [bacterium]
MQEPERTRHLLEHAPWVKSLAHHLIPDPAAAEDAVQDTWEAALRRQPGLDRPLRPWLGRVLGNFARLQQRAASRRLGRERAVAREEATPSAARLVENAELQRTLVDAVLALKEPARSTILLRYYEQESPARIAALQGVPAATVRSRIKRALETLRADLDVSWGGRETWCVAFLPLVRGAARGREAAVSVGSWTGGALVAASAAAVLVAALGIAAPSEEGPAATDPALSATNIASAGIAAPDLLRAPVHAPMVRRSAAGTDDVTIEGRAVDANGRPVADAEAGAVHLTRRAADHPLAGSLATQAVGRARTGADGRFLLRIPRLDAEVGIALELFVYTPGRGLAFRYLEAGSRPHEVELTIPDEVPIQGRLVDAGGEPLARARLSVRSLRTVGGEDDSYPFVEPPTGLRAWPDSIETDAEGAFVIRGASSNTELIVELDDARAALQRWTVAVGDAPPPHLAWTATEPRAVEGTVVVGGSAKPIAGATVIFSFWRDGRFLGRAQRVTGERGRFSAPVYACDRLGIRASAPDGKYRRFEREIGWIPGTSTQTMTLPLDPEGYERLDGTTADGRPASTIEEEAPRASVVWARPDESLDEPLDGRLLFYGGVRVGTDEEQYGVFRVDLESGRWDTIMRGGATARAAPDGTRYAISGSDGTVRVVASSPGVEPIELAGYNSAVWLPTSDALIVDRGAQLRGTTRASSTGSRRRISGA